MDELGAGTDTIAFVDMLRGFIEKYSDWKCTPTPMYASLLAENPAHRASGTPLKK
jgi:hypothetical protein